jgi:hypothetical protein
MVGGWARQKRGAWHIHAVANLWLDVGTLRTMALECGFGQQIKLVALTGRGGFKQKTPRQIARYIAGYVSGSHNALDIERDKGVRRMIYVGDRVRRVNLRFDWSKGLSALSRRGLMLWREMNPGYVFKRSHWEFLVRLAFESLSFQEQIDLYCHCPAVATWWFQFERPPPIL